jgi:hypothetical protein
MKDLMDFILPGFAGYGATKLVARIAYVQLAKKFPNASKHLAAGSTIASFLAAYYLVHRIKKFEKYHTPIVVGSAIAALQTLVTTYIPKYGWMLEAPAAAAAVTGAPPATGTETLFPGGPEVVSGDDDSLDIDDIDLGSLAGGSLGMGADDAALGLN